MFHFFESVAISLIGNCIFAVLVWIANMIKKHENNRPNNEL